MTQDDIIAYVTGLGGVLAARPGPGDGSPEISWGDTFLYYAPDGTVPAGNTQPFASIVTKDYPGDDGSRLGAPDRFRLNIGAGREQLQRWAGPGPADAVDTLFAHPVYHYLGWLAVVNPGPRTGEAVRDLLRVAHERARTRHERRAARRG